jgi:hypothetical protein
MFITPDKIIDQIQNGKKQIVNTFVKDETFKTELIKLIDIQATFAKGSIQSSLDIMNAFMNKGTAAFYKKG